MVKGYSWQTCIDYNETFSLVLRLDTIRIILSLETQLKWNGFQLDVKTTILNGFMDGEVFAEQQPSCGVVGSKNKLHKFKNDLHGLKETTRAW